jgi:hypothetical protein
MYKLMWHSTLAVRAAQQRLAVAREHHDIDGIARATDDVDEIERRIYSRRIGAIASDLARVSRERILDNATRLLEYHASSKHLLEVQFVGEDGFGSGVTQNFYEAVSGTLQKRALNKETPLWITDGHDVEYSADPDGHYAYLTNAEGLFPQPLSQQAPKLASVCDMYRFMGTLMAKACRDKFTVPLPLHPHFFVVLKVRVRVILVVWRLHACKPREVAASHLCEDAHGFGNNAPMCGRASGVYVCMYDIYIYMYMYIYICIYIHILYMYVCKYVCVYVCIFR